MLVYCLFEECFSYFGLYYCLSNYFDCLPAKEVAGDWRRARAYVVGYVFCTYFRADLRVDEWFRRVASSLGTRVVLRRYLLFGEVWR